MFVCCECCVLSGRGICDGMMTRPEESYRLLRVVVCDQETSKARRLKTATGLWKIQPQWVVTPGKQTNNYFSINANLKTELYYQHRLHCTQRTVMNNAAYMLACFKNRWYTNWHKAVQSVQYGICHMLLLIGLALCDTMVIF